MKENNYFASMSFELSANCDMAAMSSVLTVFKKALAEVGAVNVDVKEIKIGEYAYCAKKVEVSVDESDLNYLSRDADSLDDVNDYWQQQKEEAFAEYVGRFYDENEEEQMKIAKMVAECYVNEYNCTNDEIEFCLNNISVFIGGKYGYCNANIEAYFKGGKCDGVCVEMSCDEYDIEFRFEEQILHGGFKRGKDLLKAELVDKYVAEMLKQAA